MEHLKQDILVLAKQAGFDLAGISPPTVSHRDEFRVWLAAGNAASMAYLHRHLEKRLDPGRLVPGVKSILCVGLNYFQPDPNPSAPGGRVSLYAWGRDYHRVVKDRLRRLAEEIRKRIGRDFAFRAFVDSGPVAERTLAAQAGLGWIGKNACLINRQFGSFIFLGELFLDFDLPPDTPAENACGDCRKCLDACPTNAILRPGQVDARRCLAYLTIEHQGSIDSDLAKNIGQRLYGCDACQQACPYNRQCKPTHVAEFRDWILGPRQNPNEVLSWTEPTRAEKTANSPADRTTLDQWHRNAKIIKANQ